MEQRKYKPTTTKKTLCVLLSLIMAFGTFLSMTVDNILPSDIIDLRNMIVAEASTPTPKFYRYGELVGLYTTDNSGPIKYSINDNEHYTDYIAPFSITAFNSTTIYAKIGENGDEVYKDYSTTNKALGVYTESATDFDFSYNGIDFLDIQELITAQIKIGLNLYILKSLKACLKRIILKYICRMVQCIR